MDTGEQLTAEGAQTDDVVPVEDTPTGKEMQVDNPQNVPELILKVTHDADADDSAAEEKVPESEAAKPTKVSQRCSLPQGGARCSKCVKVDFM